MRSVQLTTLGTVLLASALPVVGAVLVIVDHPRPVTSSVPELQLQLQALRPDETLAGRISHKSGKFILREEHGVTHFLDDPQEARKFFGKAVVITGTIDPKTNVVHVRKITPDRP